MGLDNILHFSFFLGFFLFIVTLVFQLTMYRFKQVRKFSFRNELPFELIQGSDIKYLYIHNILILFIVLAQITFAFNFLPNLIYWYEYLLVGSFVLSSIMFYLLFFVRVFEVKRHLLVVILQALSVVTTTFALGVFAQFNIYDKQSLPLAIILYVVSVLALALMFNPRLRRWPIMDKVLQQDGTVLILRPRHFILAIYEWGYIVLHFLLFLLMYIYLWF